jgi:hypothetical protein
MAEVVMVILTILYNLSILLGCGYVVFGLGYSGWWFLLAICCLASFKRDE